MYTGLTSQTSLKYLSETSPRSSTFVMHKCMHIPSAFSWVFRCGFTDLLPSGPSPPGLWWVHWCWPLLPPPLWCRELRSCGLCDHSWWSLSTTSPRPSSVHDQRSHYTCQREEKEVRRLRRCCKKQINHPADPWEDGPLCPVKFYFINVTHRITGWRPKRKISAELFKMKLRMSTAERAGRKGALQKHWKADSWERFNKRENEGVNNFHYYFRTAINDTTDICVNCLS